MKEDGGLHCPEVEDASLEGVSPPPVRSIQMQLDICLERISGSGGVKRGVSVSDEFTRPL